VPPDFGAAGSLIVILGVGYTTAQRFLIGGIHARYATNLIPRAPPPCRPHRPEGTLMANAAGEAPREDEIRRLQNRPSAREVRRARAANSGKTEIRTSSNSPATDWLYGIAVAVCREIAIGFLPKTTIMRRQPKNSRIGLHERSSGMPSNRYEDTRRFQ